MAKAATIALLLAACAAVATATNLGTIPMATTTVDLQAIHKGISDTVSSLHTGLMQSATIGAGDMSSCTCAPKECKDKKEEVCTVTVDVKEECKDVKMDKDFVSCETKCFKADHVVEINVPTVDLSSFHAAGTGGRRLRTNLPDLGKDLGKVSVTYPDPLGLHSGGAGGAGGAGGNGKEICREICTPGVRQVTKQECEDVETPKYDCKERVVFSQCSSKCKCNGLDVEVREVPAMPTHQELLTAATGVATGLATGLAQHVMTGGHATGN